MGLARTAIALACLSIVADAAETTIDGEEIYDRYKSAVFKVTATGTLYNGQQQFAGGSGFLIDQAGYALTANHAVFANKNNFKTIDVTARLGPKESATMHGASIVAVDEDHDVALLRLKNPALFTSAIPLGSSSAVRIGSRVTVMGYPVDQDLSIVDGLLSNKGTDGRWQTSAPIDIGNSGGPMFDKNGKAIGVAWGALVQAQGVQVFGVRFLVPVDVFRSTLFSGADGRPTQVSPQCGACHAASIEAVPPHANMKPRFPRFSLPSVPVPRSEQFSKSFSIAETLDRQGSSRSVRTVFRVTPGYTFEHAELADIGRNGASEFSVLLSEDRQRATVGFTLRTGSTPSDSKSWYFGTLVTYLKKQ